MATSYPIRIDTSITLPTVIDDVTPVKATTVNILRDAILAIEAQLGVKPAGFYGTVRARLDALEVAFANPIAPGSISFNGDLSGTAISQTVIGIQNNPISTLMPVDGYVLTWNAGLGQWNPQPSSGGGGTNATFIQGFPVSPATPSNSNVLVWGSTIYDIRQLTEDDILPGFSISGFSGGSVVECGVTVTNPSFTASYSSIPTSAQITNTDGVDSPLVLSSPFTSGTVVGSFTHSTVNFSVTFTLTAIKGVTRTANQFITYEARSFGGVGSTGATSSVTASGNNAIISTGDTLNSEGLHSSDIGQSYGVFSPSGQKIYLLLQGGSHTFKDQNGFTFPMNSPTAVSFTNQHGAVISMFLYESTNLLSTPFTITVST